MRLDREDDVARRAAQLAAPSDVVPPDNLDGAQDLVDHPPTALSVEVAKAKALIDIGRTLRKINDQLDGFSFHGIEVKH